MSVEIRLLGGVSAVTSGGEPVDVGPAKCQAVLAALAMSVGSAVPVSRLVELVWGESPPRTADKTLQSYVTRLRKALGHGSIVRTGAAYRLELAVDAVDVARFQRHLASGDVQAALAEWGGTPLAGLDPGGLSATVEGLLEQWLSATEVELERQMETDAPAAIPQLTALTASYPFREGLWALLMTSLYRVGRQGDALAAYGKARQHLVEQLGVEPGPRLRELEGLILHHDEQLGVDRSASASASAPAFGSPRDLPTGTVTFGFSEVADSTRLWVTHRRDAGAAMARHDELVRGAAAGHGGHVFATGGASFGVAFHRAGDAAAWATELQAATGRERWPGTVEVRLRIGLHTGEAEERASSYYGPTVNLAALLASAAHGGQTLLSGTTAALLQSSDLHLSDLGPFHLDNVAVDTRIVQLGAGEHPLLRSDRSRRGNLPREMGRLVGRLAELKVVDEALATSPVVTLVGPGGIGKTRLALAAARLAEPGFGDGAWLVELAGVAASGDVPRAVADVLDVVENPARTLVESVAAALQPRQALLVLDNCEHVVDGAAELTQAIARSCPDVRVLATSRERLGLADEKLITVAPLDPSGSGVELFNERALAVDPTFDPHAWQSEVTEICRRLEGVPLAIDLAAARTRSLAPADLVERLDDRLRLLSGGRRGGPERHRTLRATIGWSYDLLSPPEQRLFQRLSIFAGPFDLAAAETVTAETVTAGTDDLLGELVERSMLMVESGPFGRRFRILDTMRQFGAELLAADGHTGSTSERHARWCLTEVARIGGLLTSHGEREGVGRLTELWPNLRAAFDWACATGDRRLAYGLLRPVAPEVYVRSQSEIGDWAERLLTITPPEDHGLVVFGLTWAARRYMRHLDRDGFERLVARYGEPDHPMIRFARAFIYNDLATLTEAAHQAADELHREGDDHGASLFEVAGLGVTLLRSGRLGEHDDIIAGLAERFRAQGPPSCLNWALTMLGYSASLQGRHNQAWQLFNEAAGVELPDRTHSMNNPLEARVAFRRGNQARAFRTLRAYLDELLDHDNLYLTSVAGVEFVDMMTKIGRRPEAGPVLHYLANGRHFDSSFLKGSLAGPGHSSDRELDDRQTLRYMRDVLDQLCRSEQPRI